ncbi:hypothetical protein TVAG_512120 [Trichomonas vaginalis G3]|uniref:Uncharacterized protein n=1 Tax=Trichomonas vaginalis (strain ATCC PRA-98 / G3) TaxID=412133 RepID=A2H1Z1_TRIV3|nr:hypothetical protein TVAGG3_0917580 [Trichomonas vaginalis G3]EAX76575.1 hypothetical protein TVAG_512120 [Trichomonas vaginalis G3]KAI5484920.1 hypothetical protein TVAGG3_0917580 [Trichomonas vaginalis G3]|eukprot:XP_001289505.1 hypothetical protein [Trichomonas vaginalis G3]
MTDVPPTESIPKPEEPTAPAPQQTKTQHLHFSSLTFYNLNFVRVDVNSERSMRVLYDFVLLPEFMSVKLTCHGLFHKFHEIVFGQSREKYDISKYSFNILT